MAPTRLAAIALSLVLLTGCTIKNESLFGGSPSDEKIRKLTEIADRLPPLNEGKAEIIDINANVRRIFAEHVDFTLNWESPVDDGYTARCRSDFDALSRWNLGVTYAVENYPRETYLRAEPAVTAYLKSRGFRVTGSGRLPNDHADEPYLLKTDYADDNGASYGITSLHSEKFGISLNTVARSACMHNR